MITFEKGYQGILAARSKALQFKLGRGRILKILDQDLDDEQKLSEEERMRSSRIESLICTGHCKYFGMADSI